jgi:[ribosomal protein S18]-alanine N-acetyltransferase
VAASEPRLLPPLDVVAASDEDRRWAAALMARSDPWITLGRGFDRCLQVCCDPEYLVFIARRRHPQPDSRAAVEDVDRYGVIVVQRRGVAGSPYVASLAVAAEVRGRGVGSCLLSFAEDQVRGEAAHLFLCVSSFNAPARAFYERHGYEVAAELKEYVIAGASELLMHKRLRPA